MSATDYDAAKFHQGLVDAENFLVGDRARDGRIGAQCHLLLPSPLLGGPPAGVVHQNLAHGPGGDPEEMGPALPGNGLTVHQSEKGLVHQRGRAQRVIGAFPPKL